MEFALQGVLSCKTFSAQAFIPGTFALMELLLALKLSWLRLPAAAIYWACWRQSPSIYESLVRAALPLLVLIALTALNRACSQAAVSAGDGDAGGEAGGGEVGAAATAMVTDLLALPAELVAVMV